MTSLSMSQPLPHGFVDDMPEQEYHAHQGSLSVSGAKVLLKAPALFKWQQDHPIHKDVFDFGSAAHAMVLGAGPKVAVVGFDSWRSKAAQTARDEARADGFIPLLDSDWLTVQQMADALSSHRLAMQLLSDGKPEVSAFALDEATGVLRRGRFDWLGSSILTDYKTAASAEPGAFAGSAAKFGYHCQAAWYLDLARDLGHPATAFCFIVQEKEAPYLTSVVELDDEAVQRGRELNRRALEIYRDCVASDLWPSYVRDDDFVTVSLPRWAFRDSEVASW